jgi:hypothetical protein
LLAPDGRLIVIDFGAVAQVHRSALAFLDDISLAQFANAVPLDAMPDDEIRTVALSELADKLRAIGFSNLDVDIQPEDVLSYFGPFAEPLWANQFQFSRDWLQRRAPRLPGLARGQDFLGASTLNIPAEHALMFRTVVGLVAVACQLNAEVALRDIVIHWYPDFEHPKIPPALASALGIS